MKLTGIGLIKDESGVENAVYGILMIAIVVIVALLIGSLVLSQGGQIQVLTDSPKASMTGVLNGGANPTLLINHESGDPLKVAQLMLSVFDDNGVLIGSTKVSDISPAVTPTTLSTGSQTSAIPLGLDTGKSIESGSRYTVKVMSAQSKQMIGSIVLVAR
ncbi:MAG TPA: type IV pilin N-terminal domain-containing protein [Methanocellaceae archaeon]